MAKPFDKVLGGKRNIVLLGEAGCGKSEIALNLAVRLSRDGPVHFFDMDQTKPLYRSRDARRALEARGVSFFCQEQYMNGPSLNKFLYKLVPGGTLFINSSIVTDEVTRTDVKVVRAPVTELALEMGSAKVLNIIMTRASRKASLLFISSVSFNILSPCGLKVN